MLGEALDYPTSGPDGAKAVLVGGGVLLVSAPFALVGLALWPLLGIALAGHLAVRGYYVRVLRRVAGDPDTDAPAFDEWGGLLVDGTKALLVLLGYLLPVLVLVLVAVGGQVASAVQGPGAAFSTLRTLTGLTVLLFFLYLLGMAYVLPAAVTNFAYTGRVQAAFRPEVLRGAFTEDYAVGWLLSVVLQAVALPFVLVFQALLVGFFLQFLVGVAVRYVWGRSFGAALGLDTDKQQETDASTTGSEPETNATGPTNRSRNPPDADPTGIERNDDTR